MNLQYYIYHNILCTNTIKLSQLYVHDDMWYVNLFLTPIKNMHRAIVKL